MEREDVLSKVVVELYLENDNKVLLQKRANTGYEDGKYSFIGGHLKQYETLKQALIREAKEEANIIIKEEDLQCVFIANKTGKKNCINFFFKTCKYEGEPQNMEEQKCSDLRWFELDNLPENIIELERKVIQESSESIEIDELKFI